jgi:hypothetical protein
MIYKKHCGNFCLVGCVDVILHFSQRFTEQ